LALKVKILSKSYSHFFLHFTTRQESFSCFAGKSQEFVFARENNSTHHNTIISFQLGFHGVRKKIRILLRRCKIKTISIHTKKTRNMNNKLKENRKEKKLPRL